MFVIFCIQNKTIYVQKMNHCTVSNAFVPVDKRMLRYLFKTNNRRFFSNAWVLFLSKITGLWGSDSRFNTCLVPQTSATSRVNDGIIVDLDNVAECEKEKSHASFL